MAVAETATAQVFAIPELLEMILLNFTQNEPASDSSDPSPALFEGIIPIFPLQSVNTTFRDTIADSKLLQDRLHFLPETAKASPTSVTEFCGTIQRAWSHAMLSSESTGEQSWRRIRLLKPNGPCYTIVDRRDVPKEVISGTYLEGRERSYDSTFDVDEGTTLGMLFKWTRVLEERTAEEHLEAWKRGNAREEGFAMVIRTSAFSLLY